MKWNYAVAGNGKNQVQHGYLTKVNQPSYFPSLFEGLHELTWSTDGIIMARIKR